MSAARAALGSIRRAVQVAPKGARNMSGHSQAEAEAEMNKWRSITMLVVPGCVALGVYIFGTANHGHGHEHPKYEYLHIRRKEFPWGPDGFFERPHKAHH